MAESTTASDSAARRSLMNEAVRLAESDRPEDLSQLASNLADAAYLGRLDSEDDYQAPPTSLRVAKVLQVLAGNEAPAARSAVVGLTRASGFLAVRPRQQLLVLALAEVRPSPPDAIAFWRQHAQPDAILRHVAVGAMADNGSPPAVDLLASVLADNRQRERDRVLWMQDAVLRHRTELPMLRMCDRLVRGGLPPPLQLKLLEALTDYRPQEWYLECDPPKPGSWAEAPDEARGIMRELCDWAPGNLPLDARLAAAVKATRAIVAARGPERRHR